MRIWLEGRSRTSLLLSWSAPTPLVRAHYRVRLRWMTERSYACCPPHWQTLLLSGGKYIQEEEPSTSSRLCRHEKAVEQYHHKFKYFSTRLVLPYKGKATPLWELQLLSANYAKEQLTIARSSSRCWTSFAKMEDQKGRHADVKSEWMDLWQMKGSASQLQMSEEEERAEKIKTPT